jgi:WD40 repeat protein
LDIGPPCWTVATGTCCSLCYLKLSSSTSDGTWAETQKHIFQTFLPIWLLFLNLPLRNTCGRFERGKKQSHRSNCRQQDEALQWLLKSYPLVTPFGDKQLKLSIRISCVCLWSMLNSADSFESEGHERCQNETWRCPHPLIGEMPMWDITVFPQKRRLASSEGRMGLFCWSNMAQQKVKVWNISLTRIHTVTSIPILGSCSFWICALTST